MRRSWSDFYLFSDASGTVLRVEFGPTSDVLGSANDAVLLGPDSVGQFMPTAVKTIQRKRASVNSGEAGQSVSLVPFGSFSVFG